MMMHYDRETLVAALRERGITYLAPSDARPTATISSEEDLITNLLNQSDSRLRLALVSLFIRRPELANCVPAVITESAWELQILYMAAAYLQRFWRTRLSFYLNVSLLPDLYSAELQLPPVDERFGKTGLYALADLWATRSPYPFNHLASLNKVMELLFEQLRMEQSASEFSPIS